MEKKIKSWYCLHEYVCHKFYLPSISFENTIVEGNCFFDGKE